MSVCIIGGGYSGIISAKICQSHNLQVTVINKQVNPGGVWTGDPKEVGVWDSLVTNDSKYIMSFSDYLWNPADPDYPTAAQVLSYLNEYIDLHNLRSKFLNSCTVTSVSQAGEKFVVQWLNAENLEFEQVFDYVVVATGRFARPINPLKNCSAFKGDLIHGAYYRDPSFFTGKKVVTIGKSFTGSDVAAELLQTAESVTQIYKKPYYCIPRFIRNVPYDFWTYQLPLLNTPLSYMNSFKQSGMVGELILNLVGNPSNFHPDWYIDPNTINTEYYGFTSHTDNYFDSVKQQKITLIRGEAKELYTDGIILSNDSKIEADAIILGTGYTTNFDFLSEDLKRILQYDPNDGLTTTCMYRSLFHPDVPGMCFVGAFLTDCPARFELQAEIGIRHLLGMVKIGEDEMREGVREEEFARRNLRAFQFTYDLFGYMQECFRILEVEIDWEFLRELGFEGGPILPQFLFLKREGQREKARRMIEEIKGMYPDINFAELAQ